ncbi:hypothetical protein LTR78_006188, partial [Recurvomyces mirabilis]
MPTSDLARIALSPANHPFDKLAKMFKLLPAELRNLIYTTTFEATLEDLERRASSGVYEKLAKSTLAFIEDTKASLYFFAGRRNEVEYISHSIDFDRRLARIVFSFDRVQEFLDLHLEFVKLVPTSIVRLTGRLAESMRSGSDEAHSDCFPHGWHRGRRRGLSRG